MADKEQKKTVEKDDEPLPYTQSVGLDYAVKLAFRAVDESVLPREEKRDALYSLLCLRCLFDNRMAVDPDPILLKYDCLKQPEPQKLELYDLVYKIVSLPHATVELKAMWYQMFAYVILLEAPHDPEVYALLQDVLATPEVLDAVLKNRYSVDIPFSVREMWAAEMPSRCVDWYLPYLTYKDETDDKGVTREVKECQRLLALGLFDRVITRTERLLDARPDDETLYLTNLAAKVSAADKPQEPKNQKLLRVTLEELDEYLASHKPKNQLFFLYFRGLMLIGLMRIAEAKQQFEIALDADPDFELAKMMRKALDLTEKNPPVPPS